MYTCFSFDKLWKTTLDFVANNVQSNCIEQSIGKSDFSDLNLGDGTREPGKPTSEFQREEKCF